LVQVTFSCAPVHAAGAAALELVALLDAVDGLVGAALELLTAVEPVAETDALPLPLPDVDEVQAASATRAVQPIAIRAARRRITLVILARRARPALDTGRY
jgi:hypothetical protein